MRVSLSSFRNDESGFALVLAAVVVFFLGTFITLALGIFDTRDDVDAERTTRQNAERLIDHLASFAQNYGRIPCPALPSDSLAGEPGRERRAGTIGPGGLSAPFLRNERCFRSEGLIPFASLGLQRRDARDGWGRYFTYSVSPVFTDLDAVADTGVPVSSLCRKVGAWVVSSRFLLPNQNLVPDHTAPENDVTTMRNVNPRKAKFCCPGNDDTFYWPPGTDLIVNNSIYPTTDRANLVGDVQGDIDCPYDTKRGTGVSNGCPAPDTSAGPDNAYLDIQDPRIIAFVIVSHGPNGLGAYLPGILGNIKSPAPINAEEIENGNGDNVFTDAPRILVQGGNYNDDMIFYRTQRSLYSELNNATCLRPFR